MAKLNVKKKQETTYEGATACKISPLQQLRRSVMSCMLWENEFYEAGDAIAHRIESLVSLVLPQEAMSIADEARNEMHLRHVGLLIVKEMAKLPTHRCLVAETLGKIIKRPDEMAEFLAIYWKDRKMPLSAQIKKGLAKAFCKFDEYQLSKYNRKAAVKLKDVMFLVHPKPQDKEQEEIWKRLASGKLKTADTWETSLSAGHDKKETWERLLSDNRLGALAFLRNLRNMAEAGVDEQLIKAGLAKMKTEELLPFRFLAAAPYVPHLEQDLESTMLKSLKDLERLKGNTVMLIDVSASMSAFLSKKSNMSRDDAANGLAVILRELCENIKIYTFSNVLAEVPSRRGFALVSAIRESQEPNLTYLCDALEEVNSKESYDRIVVITDEQAAAPTGQENLGSIPSPKGRGYMINIASAQRGIGYGDWIHIDGWSQSVAKYILNYEKM